MRLKSNIEAIQMLSHQVKSTETLVTKILVNKKTKIIF
jgi:hypothetical protein